MTVRFTKQSRYTGVRRHREICAKPVYRRATPQGSCAQPVYWRATPQGSLRKAGIPASDVLGLNTNDINNFTFVLIKFLPPSNDQKCVF